MRPDSYILYAVDEAANPSVKVRVGSAVPADGGHIVLTMEQAVPAGSRLQIEAQVPPPWVSQDLIFWPAYKAYLHRGVEGRRPIRLGVATVSIYVWHISRTLHPLYFNDSFRRIGFTTRVPLDAEAQVVMVGVQGMVTMETAG